MARVPERELRLHQARPRGAARTSTASTWRWCRRPSGSGGWPMTVFPHAPDRRPVFGGTYFPPRGAYGRPGFLEILRRAGAPMWRERRDELERAAGSVVDSIRGYLEGRPAGGGPRARSTWRRPRAGGGGRLRRPGGRLRSGAEVPAAVGGVPCCCATPTRTARRAGGTATWPCTRSTRWRPGGMYDHLGGGFHPLLRRPALARPALREDASTTRASSCAPTSKPSRRPAPSTTPGSPVTLPTTCLRDLTTADGAFCSAEDADSAVSADDPEHAREVRLLPVGLRRGARRARRGAIGRPVSSTSTDWSAAATP